MLSPQEENQLVSAFQSSDDSPAVEADIAAAAQHDEPPPALPAAAAGSPLAASTTVGHGGANWGGAVDVCGHEYCGEGHGGGGGIGMPPHMGMWGGMVLDGNVTSTDDREAGVNAGLTMGAGHGEDGRRVPTTDDADDQLQPLRLMWSHLLETMNDAQASQVLIVMPDPLPK